jgi:diaminohydroxyphosphoribosylaminopyrimidine deaminase/5-amino-6-(5-phosphoribosylamino)uracil reductase
LIAARVRRVVIALPDPNPDAAGGVKALRQAGIEVEVGVGREAAAALNAPFLWGLRRPELPFVALKIATSVDGFMATAGGGPQWISGSEARDYVHWLRAGFDAIGVGRQTAEADDPQLTVRGPLVPRVPPHRVVFTRLGNVRPDLKMMRTASAIPTIVQVIDNQGLKASLVKLRTKGIRSLLIEGGPTLAAALLADGLVDRLYWIQAPTKLGSGKTPFGRGAPSWPVTERRPLGRDTLLVMDRELCLPGS